MALETPTNHCSCPTANRAIIPSAGMIALFLVQVAAREDVYGQNEV